MRVSTILLAFQVNAALASAMLGGFIYFVHGVVEWPMIITFAGMTLCAIGTALIRRG